MQPNFSETGVRVSVFSSLPPQFNPSYIRFIRGSPIVQSLPIRPIRHDICGELALIAVILKRRRVP
jgi:hypothetical protein